MSLLTVENLTVAFGGLRAVDGLSTRVEAGIIKGIIGPNGAGKTTLFNAIAGIQSIASGRVLLDGVAVEHLKPWQRAHLGIARTFQNLQVFGELSLIENVMIGGHPRTRSGFLRALVRTPGVAREERDLEQRAWEKLALFGMADRAGQPAEGLSFGEAKLLEMARALAADPRILMLDEPIAGVPAGEQGPIMAMIREVNATGVTVILVEHNMRMVMGLCDEILVMRNGRFLAEDTPAAIGAHPEVVAAYLGAEYEHA